VTRYGNTVSYRPPAHEGWKKITFGDHPLGQKVSINLLDRDIRNVYWDQIWEPIYSWLHL